MKPVVTPEVSLSITGSFLPWILAAVVGRCQPAPLLSVHVGGLTAELREHEHGGNVRLYRRGAGGGGELFPR